MEGADLNQADQHLLELLVAAGAPQLDARVKSYQARYSGGQLNKEGRKEGRKKEGRHWQSEL